MEQIALFIFLISFSLIVFHFLLYPLILRFIAPSKTTKPEKKSIAYPVSFIISAYKEESIIRSKIENTLSLNYPKDCLEIIVCSDGDDGTESIVKEFKKQGVISLHSKSRQGKANAINRGLRKASHQIVCLSDANCLLENNALINMTSLFPDPLVGGVCGRKIVQKSAKRQAANGNHMFWQLESSIKSLQSRIDSITTGDGELFALRKNAISNLQADTVNDDTALTLMITSKKLKVKYAPDAICYEAGSSSLREDFHVKSRIAYGHLQILSNYWHLILKSGPIFTLNFIAHKIIRHLMPYLTILSILSAGVCLHQIHLTRIVLPAFTLALLVMLGVRAIRQPMVSFALANLAIFDGTIKFLRRSSHLSIWAKAARQ